MGAQQDAQKTGKLAFHEAFDEPFLCRWFNGFGAFHGFLPRVVTDTQISCKVYAILLKINKKFQISQKAEGAASENSPMVKDRFNVGDEILQVGDGASKSGRLAVGQMRMVGAPGMLTANHLSLSGCPVKPCPSERGYKGRTALLS